MTAPLFIRNSSLPPAARIFICVFGFPTVTGDIRQEIDRHLQKIFPDRDAERDIPAGIDKLGPDNALAFWLKGFYRNNAKFPLTGKVYLGIHPITGDEVWVELAEEEYLVEVHDGDSVSLMTSTRFIPLGVSQDELSAHDGLLANYQELQSRQGSVPVLLEQTPLYNFDVKRLSVRNQYRPRCCAAPLIYFRSSTYPVASFTDRPEWGTAMPYLSKGTQFRFVEAHRFQIICAGRDGRFGLGSIDPNEAVHHAGHADNFTNFTLWPLSTQHVIAWRNEAMMARSLSIFVAVACSLAYPVLQALRRNRDDLVALTEITRNQLLSLECTDSWRRELEKQRHRRRDRIIERMSASSTANRAEQARNPDVPAALTDV